MDVVYKAAAASLGRAALSVSTLYLCKFLSFSSLVPHPALPCFDQAEFNVPRHFGDPQWQATRMAFWANL